MNRLRRPHEPEAPTHGGSTVAVRTGALDALADRVGRLRPSHRDPEAFHVEKDAIERELRRLALQTL